MLPHSHPDITLQRVTDLDSPQFARCLTILRQAIPPSEQLSEQRLTALIARDDYRLYALLRQNTVAAMAVLYLPKAEPFALLDYMAVESGLRGNGLGSSLLREIIDLASKERPSAGFLLFEVDDDRSDPPDGHSINLRRIAFYRRLGAQLLLNVEYLFPSPGGPPVPMHLMAYRLLPEATLTRDALAAALADIFQEIHGRASEDVLLRSILDRLPDKPRLE
jgi:GNAT superfamily N-acetyltransferase